MRARHKQNGFVPSRGVTPNRRFRRQPMHPGPVRELAGPALPTAAAVGGLAVLFALHPLAGAAGVSVALIGGSLTPTPGKE